MSKKMAMVGLMLLLVLGAATGVYAQSGTSGGTGSGSGTAGDTGTAYSDTDRDDGPDFGWIGLLGLAGLMGLKRREVHRDARSTTTAPVR